MPAGRGVYGHITDRIIRETDASCVILIVAAGKLGSGFDVALTSPSVAADMPRMLREVADEMERTAPTWSFGKRDN